MKIKLVKQSINALAVCALVFAQASTVSAATDADLLDATDAGISYLETQQQTDGSITGAFGSETEWTVIAVVANGEDPHEIQTDEGVSLVDAIADDVVDTSTPALDVERKILALTAAGEDTADFAGVDYNQLLAKSSNGGQFGELTQLNDDAFGIIAVRATGDVTLEDEAQDALNYLIDHQEADGGFSWATSDNPYYYGADGPSTAATLVAFDAAEKMGIANPGLKPAQDDGYTYLLALQQPNGGFVYDTFSVEPDTGTTSWALMALNIFKDRFSSEILAANEWLLSMQNGDGGFQYGAYGLGESSAYYTSQVVLGLLGTTWLLEPEPMVHPQEKPEAEVEEGPIVATPIETPVISQIAGAVTRVVSTYRPTTTAVIAAPTDDQDEEQNASSATTTEESDESLMGAEADQGTSPAKIVGYVLIGLSLAGLLTYVLRVRSVPTGK